jgi:hypothetical protein
MPSPISDERLLRNVRDARDNGYDLVCAECGVGMTDDEFEEEGSHDVGCPNEGRDRAAEMVKMIEDRLGRKDPGDG